MRPHIFVYMKGGIPTKNEYTNLKVIATTLDNISPALEHDADVIIDVVGTQWSLVKNRHSESTEVEGRHRRALIDYMMMLTLCTMHLITDGLDQDSKQAEEKPFEVPEGWKAEPDTDEN